MCCAAVLQEAQAARTQTDGYKLDKNHTFKVSMFDDFDRYSRVPDEYAALEIKEYSPAVRPVSIVAAIATEAYSNKSSSTH